MAKVKRQAPQNLQPGDEFHFAENLEMEIPEPRIIAKKNVRINADGLLYRGAKALDESFSGGTLDLPIDNGLKKRRRQSFLRNPFFLKDLFKKKIKIEEPCLWFTDEWSQGYFHWFADSLPRLFLAKDRLDKCLVLLPERYQKIRFITASLAAFKPKIKWIKDNEVMIVENLILPAHLAVTGNYNEKIISELKNFLLADGKSQNEKAEERIYISRAKAKKRRVGNEEEIKPVLEKYGFRTVYLEDFRSWEEQIALCRRVKYLISVHGAGLTNMLFMPGLNAVLELREKEEAGNNCYFSLASALKIKYFYQTGRTEKSAGMKNIIIDKDELEKNISLVVSQSREI